MSSLSRKVSRQLLWGYFFFFKRKAKSLETHSTENRTGRGIEPIGKKFGDIPKPINLFIWEGGGWVGREGGKGLTSFLFVPILLITHLQDLLVLLASRRMQRGWWRAGRQPWEPGS